MTTNGGATSLHRAAIGVNKGPESLELLLNSTIDKTIIDEDLQNFLHKLAQSDAKIFDEISKHHPELITRDKFEKFPQDYKNYIHKQVENFRMSRNTWAILSNYDKREKVGEGTYGVG